MSDSDPDGFVTIAEAGRRLGISERTARRRAARLSGSDRQESGTCPARVRLSALRALGNGHESRSEQAPEKSGASPAPDRHVPDSTPVIEPDLVAELRAEVAFLRDLVTKEKAEKAELLAVVSEQVRTVRDQARQIEAGASRPEEAQRPALPAPGLVPSAAPTTQDSESPPRRSWWGRLWQRG